MDKKRYRRNLWPQLIFILCLGLIFSVPPSTPAEAQALTTSTPGCDAGFREVQRSMGLTGLGRSVAVAEQLIDRPASVQQMTCFQSIMGIAGMSGGIFSDTMNFGVSVATSLVAVMNGLISAPIQEWMHCNYVDTILVALGATIINGLTNTIAGLVASCCGGLASIVGNVIAGLAALDFECAIILEAWKQLIFDVATTTGAGQVSLCMLANGNFGAAGDRMLKIFDSAGMQISRSNLGAGMRNLNQIRRQQIFFPNVGGTGRTNVDLYRRTLCGGRC